MALFGHAAPLVQPTAGCAYAARVSFDWCGRVYEIDEDFPHKQLGLSEQRTFDLWSAGLLKVKVASSASKKRKAG